MADFELKVRGVLKRGQKLEIEGVTTLRMEPKIELEFRASDWDLVKKYIDTLIGMMNE